MTDLFRGKLHWLSAGLMACAIPASPLLAQEVYDKPSGQLRLVETDDLEVEIHLGDRVFKYPEASRAYVLEQRGTDFLLFLATGGNACPGYFAWVEGAAGTATHSFGTCSDLYELAPVDDGFSLTVPSIVIGEGDMRYTWLGGSDVTEDQLGLQPSDTPPGADPAGWLGKHPAELLGSSDWEALLLNVLTPQELENLRTAAKLSSGFELQDGWVAAFAYDNISDTNSAIALHPDGELLVALGAYERRDALLWGVTSHPYPAAIQQVLDGK